MQRIGPYQVEAELGRGGMGVVYRVRDEQGRSLALKLILPGVAGGEAMARFGREAEVMGRVKHPNVIRIHNLGRAPEGPYMVSELIDGEELKERLKRGLLPPKQVAAILRALADAVAACHREGVLHRDLKPANVMLRTDDGSPVLLDFGIAQDQSAEQLTKTGTLMGTLNYMSPEQAAGEKVDGQTDVYGLGAILYTCISGEPPYANKSSMALVKAVLTDPLRPPSSIRDDVDPGLAAICQKAMAKEKHERYGSPEELREELDTYLTGKPPRALREQQERKAGGSRTALVLGALLLAAGVGAGWLATRGGAAEDPEDKQAASAERRAQRKRGDDYKGLMIRRGEAFLDAAEAWWEVYRDVPGLDAERAEVRKQYLRYGLEHPTPVGEPLETKGSWTRFRVLPWNEPGWGTVVFRRPEHPHGFRLLNAQTGDHMEPQPFADLRSSRLAWGETTALAVSQERRTLTWVTRDGAGEPESFDALELHPQGSIHGVDIDEERGLVALACEERLPSETSQDGMQPRGVLFLCEAAPAKPWKVLARHEFPMRGLEVTFFGDGQLCLSTGDSGRLHSGKVQGDKTAVDVHLRFFAVDDLRAPGAKAKGEIRLNYEVLFARPSPTSRWLVAGTVSSRQVLLLDLKGLFIAKRLTGPGALTTDLIKEAGTASEAGGTIQAGMRGTPNDAAWSPDGERLYVVCGDRNRSTNGGKVDLRAWRIPDGEPLGAFLPEKERRPDRVSMDSVAVMNGGTHLVTASVTAPRGDTLIERWRVDLPRD